MTENEAKANLEVVTSRWESDEEMFSDSMDISIDQEFVNTLHTAIKALEEVQQYRAIGTVEELQDMKSNYFEALSDWHKYRKIGTLEE